MLSIGFNPEKASHMLRFPLALSVLALCLSLCLGCGDNGPPRYSISGKVTSGGTAIPTGSIKFVPDEGNEVGETTYEIKNGAYSSTGSDGIGGGHYNVVVFAYDGVPYEDTEGKNETGKPLFPPYTTTADLEKKSQSFDVDVPSTHSKKP
jgi:hypothetical protein